MGRGGFEPPKQIAADLQLSLIHIFGCNVTDQLLDQYRFPNAGTTEQTDLTTSVSYTHLDVYKRQGRQHPVLLNMHITLLLNLMHSHPKVLLLPAYWTYLQAPVSYTHLFTIINAFQQVYSICS